MEQFVKNAPGPRFNAAFQSAHLKQQAILIKVYFVIEIPVSATKLDGVGPVDNRPSTD